MSERSASECLLEKTNSESTLRRDIRDRNMINSPETGSTNSTKASKILTRLWSFFSSQYNSLTFSFINPLLKQGAANELDEYSAIAANPLNKTIEDLQTEFDQIYNRLREDSDKSEKKLQRNFVLRALLRQHAYSLLMHFLLTIGSMCSRLLGPLSIRWFLIWLRDYKDGEAEASKGWLWGLVVIVSPLAFTLIRNQVFWIGCSLGWKAKLSMIAAIHAKLLKLSSSSVTKITTGHVVNLASNDVQRLNEASVYWQFMILGPLETLIVLVLLSIVLGFLPAMSGIGCTLVLIPLQSLLSKQIGKYREKTTKITDTRINFMSELISGNLAVKMLGWEDPLLEEINGIRSKEHHLLKKMNYIKANALAMSGYIQTVMACITFVVYRFTGDQFRVTDVMFAISMFSLPRVWMAVCLPTAVHNHCELLVSTRRLDKFFRLPEVSHCVHVEEKTVQNGEITIEHGNYGWYSVIEDNDKGQESSNIFRKMSDKVSGKGKNKCTSEGPELVQTLTDIGFHVHPGELVGITGKVGSGKSSLLLSLLNDMENLNPEHLVWMTGSVSYCTQVPWIMAATVRDNIVFGNEFNEDLYDRVIAGCALEVDFEQFPFGDQTEIGERGINLSGGQKARISLARAAYTKADVNLLDDPLSAVDPKVGKVLFKRCISGVDGLMKNSTRLLVTHQKQFLPHCDRIILMDRGQIECMGTWSELDGHDLLKDVDAITSNTRLSKQHAPTYQATTKQAGEIDASIGKSDDSTSETQGLKDINASKNKFHSQLVDKEEKAYGQVSWAVFWEYIVHIGVAPMLLTFLAMLVNRLIYFGTELWIAEWASTNEDDQQHHLWIWILVALTGGAIVTITLAMFAMFNLLTCGSTSLHKKMAEKVMHAPLSFFHQNSSGRILNRFSRDTGIQDDELPYNAGDVLLLTLHVIGTMVIVCIALPYMVPVLMIIIWIFGKVRGYYLVTSREIRRYDATTRSPVYVMLSSNIKALPTIHAFRKEALFHSMFLEALKLNGSWWMAYLTSSRWVSLRLDFLVTIVCTLTVILAVSLANKVGEEVLGLALVYIVSLSGILQWWMRQTAELENRMTSVERNLEYIKLDQEPPRASEGGGEAPPNWPTKGTIEYSSVSALYRLGLNPVLKQLEFVVAGGSSVGIVGRTGSGKSSLLLSLFRLIDISEGTILIDGVDTSSIGIDVLRRQLAIIPQDPVLFGGTIRRNLDPWSEFGDAQIWDVLRKVHLHETLQNHGGLDALVAECGDNLSVGQRQLLCLARALLTDSKILALDEATANIDRNTDALIQDALRSLIAKHDKTLLIIAHRVDTILDCDVLLVLDGGRVVEFGSPSSLLSQADGVFRRMVDAAREAANIKSLSAQG